MSCGWLGGCFVVLVCDSVCLREEGRERRKDGVDWEARHNRKRKSMLSIVVAGYEWDLGFGGFVGGLNIVLFGQR